MNFLLQEQKPNILQSDEWHLPFVLDTEYGLDLETRKKISAARCARVSYSLFDGKTSDIASDIKLCERLSSSGHWSPFEHVASALNTKKRMGNLIGWKQFRKEFKNESGGDYV